MPLKIQPITHEFNTQPFWLRCCITLIAVSAVAILTLYTPIIHEQAVFLLFFFAIIPVCFWFGQTQGILALTVSLLIVNTLILIPADVGFVNATVINSSFSGLSIIVIVTINLYRRSTEALKLSQHDLGDAQQIGKIGKWRINIQRNELYWSEEIHCIFGISKTTSLTYETFLAAVYPDDREYVNRMWQAALLGEPYEIEHRILVAGKLKWVREKGVLEFNKHGTLLGGFGITQDITEYKLYEQLLAESQQRYAAIVESAMDAIVTINDNQQIALFNKAAETMFGCHAVNAIGKSIKGFIPKLFSVVHGLHIDGSEGSGVKNSKLMEVVTGVRTNGEEFPIEISISQLKLNQQKSYTLIIRDITERVQAEHLVKKQLILQDQLAKVAATVPGLICAFQLHSNGVVTMPYASPAIESIYGVKADVVCEDISPIFSRIHIDDLEHIQVSMVESARTFDPWRETFRYHHPRRGDIWLEGHSIPRRESDGSILWHGYIHDVTERIRVQQEFQKRIDRYELVLEGAQDAIWDWDVANKRVHFSTRWKALRGFAENEMSDREEEWSQAIHPDDKARIFAAVQSHFDGKTPYYCEEYRIQCKDGSWKWILDRGVAQKDSNGQVIRMAGSENDITERKLAEWALRDRENELRLIMDATPALIAYLSTDFRYLRINATYQNWFGITSDGILGREAREVIGNQAWGIVEPYLLMAKTGKRIDCDQIMPYANHDFRWVHATYIPDKDLTGGVKGIVVHIVDIEDRKRYEHKINVLNQNLRRRIEEMQVIFDTVPVGLSIAEDVSGEYIRGNPAIERMLYLTSPRELSQQDKNSISSRILLDGKELAAEELPMQRAIHGEIVNNQILEVIHPDGNIAILLSNSAPLFNEEGKPRGAVGAFLDITALKQAEAALRESEARLSLVVKQVKAGYWDWDIKSQILFVSHECKLQLGVDKRELLNRWEEFECRLHPDERTLVWSEVENYVAGADPEFELEFRLCHEDGSYRWIHLRCGLLRDQNNHPYRMLGINLDITEYKKTKERNVRRDQMEQTSRFYVASQTAAAIAHELNQPLTAIASYADVALDLLQKGHQNSQTLAHIMENCSLQSQRAGNVIRQLMNVLHKGEMTGEPIDINYAVREALDFIKAEGQLGTFNVTLDLSTDLSLITANALQIQKVLINLMHNGLDSMRKSENNIGMLSISTRCYLANQSMVEVIVSDSGQGIADNVSLKTIFQPFYTTKATGLGMGLAISRALIETHHGKMWAEQNKDFGFSIHFTLPFSL